MKFLFTATSLTSCFRAALILIFMNGLTFGQQMFEDRALTYDEAAYRAYRAYQMQDYKRAADLLVEAARLKGVDNDTFFFDAATVYAQAKDYDKALVALEAAVDVGLLDVQKVISNPLLEPLKTFPGWSELISKLEKNQRAFLATLTAPQLREELLIMWANDQKARLLLEQKRRELKTDYSSPELAAEFKRINETDSINAQRIKEIVEVRGWVSVSAVGRDGAFAAWAIVQHSNDVKFQEKCLKAMKKVLDQKEINPVEYAELHDRIRRNKYEKQLYAMAIRRGKDENEFYPIEDEGNLDQRRKLIDLEPSTVYAKLNGFIYKPLSVAEAKKRDSINHAAARDLINRSTQAFKAGNYKEAKRLFDEALSYYGEVSAEEIYKTAIRFANAKTEPEFYRNAIFTYLHILINKGWNNKRRLLKEASFSSLYSDARWKELIIRF